LLGLGLYNSVAATLLPGTHIDHVNGLSTTSNNATVTGALAGTTATLEPGLYYADAIVDTTGGTAAINTINQAFGWMGAVIGDATAVNFFGSGVSQAGFTLAGTYATWPDMTGQTFGNIMGGNRGPALIAKFQ
jgi:hypothetical protein